MYFELGEPVNGGFNLCLILIGPKWHTVTDPELKLKVGEGGAKVALIVLLLFLPSIISTFFTQNKGGAQPPPLDLPLAHKPSNCT